MTDDYTNQEPVQPHTYTHIDPDNPEDDIVVCNDCGASGESEDEIVHYPSCTPGMSARWQQLYKEQADRWNNEAWNPDEDLTLEDDDPNPYSGTWSEE